MAIKAEIVKSPPKPVLLKVVYSVHSDQLFVVILFWSIDLWIRPE